MSPSLRSWSGRRGGGIMPEPLSLADAYAARLCATRDRWHELRAAEIGGQDVDVAEVDHAVSLADELEAVVRFLEGESDA
jgi:hypothetical protein